MKNKRFEIWLFITMCIALSSTACGTMSDRAKKTPYYSITIDGEQKYYSDQDDSIKSIKELTEEYLMVSAQSDYQNLSMVEKEFSFFTAKEQAEREGYDWIGSIKEQIKGYQLQNEVSEHKITSIQLKSKHAKQLATVTCDYITSTKNATDDYLEAVGISIGKKYKRTLTLELKLEKGEWKIQDYSNTKREEV